MCIKIIIILLLIFWCISLEIDQVVKIKAFSSQLVGKTLLSVVRCVLERVLAVDFPLASTDKQTL